MLAIGLGPWLCMEDLCVGRCRRPLCAWGRWGRVAPLPVALPACFAVCPRYASLVLLDAVFRLGALGTRVWLYCNCKGGAVGSCPGAVPHPGAVTVVLVLSPQWWLISSVTVSVSAGCGRGQSTRNGSPSGSGLWADRRWCVRWASERGVSGVAAPMVTSCTPWYSRSDSSVSSRMVAPAVPAVGGVCLCRFGGGVQSCSGLISAGSVMAVWVVSRRLATSSLSVSVM